MRLRCDRCNNPDGHRPFWERRVVDRLCPDCAVLEQSLWDEHQRKFEQIRARRREDARNGPWRRD